MRQQRHQIFYFHQKASIEQKIIVVDLGGGTSDVSIVEGGQGVIEVKSTAGDSALGGEDFDQVIVDQLMARMRKRFGLVPRFSTVQESVLREAAVGAKIELSSSDTSRIFLPGFITNHKGGYEALDEVISREAFSSWIAPHVERICALIEKALRGAKLSAPQISCALFIGGTSRIPIIRKEVAKRLRIDPHFEVERENCVAYGAALVAEILSGRRSDAVILDVIPNALSVQTMGGSATFFVAKDTTIPTTKSASFSTTIDGQDEIQIHIYEGEAAKVEDNTFIGKVTLSGIPPAPKGIPNVEVTFDVDPQGTINVRALDKGTKRESQAVLSAPFRLNESQIQLMSREVELALKPVLDRLMREKESATRTEEVERANDVIANVQNLIGGLLRGVSINDLQPLEQARHVVDDYVQRGVSSEALKDLVSGICK